MGHGKSMPLSEAVDIAAKIYTGLERHSQRIVVAGSVRRERLRCSDIEVVLEPLMAGDLFGEPSPILEPLHHLLREKAGRWLKGGDRYVQIGDVLGNIGVNLDVYIVHPPAMWGSIVAIRTGPYELGRYCMSKMRARHILHNEGYAVSTVTGKVLPTHHEDDFFSLAGVPNVAPNQRDALARKIGAM